MFFSITLGVVAPIHTGEPRLSQGLKPSGRDWPKAIYVDTFAISRVVSELCNRQEKGGETPGKRRISLCKQ